MLRSTFLLFALLGLIPMIVLYPHIGVLVWVWVSTFNPHRLAAGFMTSAPLLMVLGGITLGAWFFSREPKLPKSHAIIWAIGLFFFWTCLSTLLTPEMPTKANKLDTFFKMTVFTFLIATLMYRRDRLEYLLLIIICSLGFYAMRGSVGTILSGGKYSFTGPPDSILTDRNHIGVAFVMCIPLLLYIASHFKDRWVRLLAFAALPMFVLATIGTQSRGAFIALAVMTLWLVLRSRKKLMGIIAMLLIGGIAIGFMPASWTERMKTVESFEADTSAMGRIQMWRYALDVANDRPLTGGGFKAFANRRLAGNYLPAGMPLRASHSIYFEALGEHGYPGLFFYLNILAAYFFTCGQVMRLCRKREELRWAGDMASMLQVSLIGFVVGGAFLEIVVFDLLYNLAATAMCLHLIVLKELNMLKDRPTLAQKAGLEAEWMQDDGKSQPGFARS
jgi:probable O-glycosylation ligase (exosortase A-associated)